MDQKSSNFIYLLFLIIFLIILTLTTVSFYFIGSKEIPFIISIFVQYHVFFMFSIAIFGLIFGSYSHLILNKRLDDDRNKAKQTIEKLLSLLSYEEKRIIEYLLKNKGGCTQYELSKLEGLGKLKVHRALIKLEMKKVITKEKLGKINKVFLNLDLS